MNTKPRTPATIVTSGDVLALPELQDLRARVQAAYTAACADRRRAAALGRHDERRAARTTNPFVAATRTAQLAGELQEERDARAAWATYSQLSGDYERRRQELLNAYAAATTAGDEALRESAAVAATARHRRAYAAVVASLTRRPHTLAAAQRINRLSGFTVDVDGVRQSVRLTSEEVRAAVLCTGQLPPATAAGWIEPEA